MSQNTLRATLLLLLLAILPWLASCGTATTGAIAPAAESHYLYSYFTGNGEDGLHLAHSRDGLNWSALNGGRSLLAPVVGESRLMRDPSIIRAPDGTFHMVWTAGWTERGIGYAHSPDLVTWSEQRYLPVMAHEPTARNTWAPELFHDAANQQYLIIWATTIPGRFAATDGQDARGDNPGYNHRLYYVTTKDFQTFSETKLFYDRAFNVIDGALFTEGDRYVLVLKDETNLPFTPQKNLRLAFADRAEGPYSEPTAPITGDYWAEGPTPLEIDGRWHIYFDKYRDGKYGVVGSDDLVNWTDLSDQLMVPEGMRHGTVFRVPADIAERLLAR